MMPLTMPLRQISRDRARDHLIDLLRSSTLEKVVEDTIDRLIDFESESNGFLRRRKWCLRQIHSRDELRAQIEANLAQLEPFPAAIEPDAISGGDSKDEREATLWEAWFGLAPSDSTGGTGWGSPDDVDWGETVGTATFDDLEDAADFVEGLNAAGIANSGVFAVHGGWQVVYDPDGSD